MKLYIRDSTGKISGAEVEAANIIDARTRVLIDGIHTDQDEWLNPAHIVAIQEVPNGE